MHDDTGRPPAAACRPRLRAFGRTLVDFGGPAGLTAGERRLVDACRAGTTCSFGRDVPNAVSAAVTDAAGSPAAIAADDGRTIRAGVLRFLLLGGDEDTPVHERGVQLVGARVVGALDLRGARLDVPMIVRRCRLDDVSLRDATARRVQLDGSHVTMLSTGSARIEGALYLRDGFTAHGHVFLEGATISGDLGCRAATFHDGIDADRIEVRGGVYLDAGVTVTGGVRLVGAVIGADLVCRGARLRNEAGACLTVDDATIGQGADLGDGFLGEGAVRFSGTHIDGDLRLSGGTFRCRRERREGHVKHARPRAVSVLVLDRATVGGTLWLAPAVLGDTRQIVIDGSVMLIDARVKTLEFHPDALPTPQVVDPAHPDVPLDTIVHIDGFTYGHLVVHGPLPPEQAMSRLLARQPSRHQGADFRPQPYEQLIKTFTVMGRDDEARVIARRKAVAKRNRARAKRQERVARLLARGTSALPSPAGRLVRRLAAHAIAATGAVGQGLLVVTWEWLLGAGYGRKRFLVLFVAIWLACAGLYHVSAAVPGAFVPVNQTLLVDGAVRAACAGTATPPPLGTPIHWTHCRTAPAGFNGFNALFYSLDLMLPFSLLGQRRDWQPTHDPVSPTVWALGTLALPKGALLGVTWAQIVVALVLYVVLTGLVTGLIKRT
jgi:hypothetical protein